MAGGHVTAQAGRQPHLQLSRPITAYHGTDTPSQADKEHLAFTPGARPAPSPTARAALCLPARFIRRPFTLLCALHLHSRQPPCASPHSPSAGCPHSPPHLPRQAVEGGSAALGPAAAPHHGPAGRRGHGEGKQPPPRFWFGPYVRGCLVFCLLACLFVFSTASPFKKNQQNKPKPSHPFDSPQRTPRLASPLWKVLRCASRCGSSRSAPPPGPQRPLRAARSGARGARTPDRTRLREAAQRQPVLREPWGASLAGQRGAEGCFDSDLRRRREMEGRAPGSGCSVGAGVCPPARQRPRAAAKTNRPTGGFVTYWATKILKIANMWNLLGHLEGIHVHCFTWNIKVIKLNGHMTRKLYETLGDLQSNCYAL